MQSPNSNPRNSPKSGVKIVWLSVPSESALRRSFYPLRISIKSSENTASSFRRRRSCFKRRMSSSEKNLHTFWINTRTSKKKLQCSLGSIGTTSAGRRAVVLLPVILWIPEMELSAYLIHCPTPTRHRHMSIPSHLTVLSYAQPGLSMDGRVCSSLLSSLRTWLLTASACCRYTLRTRRA